MMIDSIWMRSKFYLFFKRDPELIWWHRPLAVDKRCNNNFYSRPKGQVNITAWMCRLIRVFARHTCNLVGNVPRLISYTVDSRYLEVQGNLLKRSRYPYLDISDLQNWGKIKRTTIHFGNEYVIWLRNLELYWKYCGQEEKLLLRSNFLFFSTIFCYLLLDFNV